MPTSPIPASSTRTCSRSASRPRRASRSATSAARGALLGGTQALAGGGRRRLGREQPIAIDHVGGAELVEDGPRPLLACGARRPASIADRLALGEKPRLPLGERPRIGIGAGDPLLVVAWPRRTLGRRSPPRPGGPGPPPRGGRPGGRAACAAPPRGSPRSRARRRRVPRRERRPRGRHAARRPPRARPALLGAARPPPRRARPGRRASRPLGRCPPPPGRRSAPPPPRARRAAATRDSSARAISCVARVAAARSAAAAPARSLSARSDSRRSSSDLSRSSSARRSSGVSPLPRTIASGVATTDPSRLTTTQPSGMAGCSSRAAARSGNPSGPGKEPVAPHRPGRAGRRPPGRPRRAAARRSRNVRSRGSPPVAAATGAVAGHSTTTIPRSPASCATASPPDQVRPGDVTERGFDRRPKRRIHLRVPRRRGDRRSFRAARAIPRASSSAKRAPAASTRPLRAAAAGADRRRTLGGGSASALSLVRGDPGGLSCGGGSALRGSGLCHRRTTRRPGAPRAPPGGSLRRPPLPARSA